MMTDETELRQEGFVRRIYRFRDVNRNGLNFGEYAISFAPSLTVWTEGNEDFLLTPEGAEELARVLLVFAKTKRLPEPEPRND